MPRKKTKPSPPQRVPANLPIKNSMLQSTHPAGKLAGILTTTDRETAEALGKELQRLTTHCASHGVGLLVDRYRAAAEFYLSAPSDVNFLALQTAAFEREFSGQVRRPSQVAAQALVNFLGTAVREWTRGIVDRALPRARAEFEKVRERECERHHRLTGQSLNFSEIVEASRRVVVALEQLDQLVKAKDFTARPNAILAGLNQFDPSWVPPPVPDAPKTEVVALTVVPERTPHPMEQRESGTNRGARLVAAAFGGAEFVPGAV